MAIPIGSRFTYYCGANAQVKLGGTLVGEAVRIEYILEQNRMPLYGYNAPEFSAVADGQILVQGRLSINYVSHEYLLAVIRNQLTNSVVPSTQIGSQTVQLSTQELDAILKTGNDTHVIAALKTKFWGQTAVRNSQGQFNTDIRRHFGRPDQHDRSVDIEVTYGDINTGNATLHTLKHVFFKGRTMTTLISEDPQIETFDFFARTII